MRYRLLVESLGHIDYIGLAVTGHTAVQLADVAAADNTVERQIIGKGAVHLLLTDWHGRHRRVRGIIGHQQESFLVRMQFEHIKQPGRRSKRSIIAVAYTVEPVERRIEPSGGTHKHHLVDKSLSRKYVYHIGGKHLTTLERNILIDHPAHFRTQGINLSLSDIHALKPAVISVGDGMFESQAYPGIKPRYGAIKHHAERTHVDTFA